MCAMMLIKLRFTWYKIRELKAIKLKKLFLTFFLMYQMKHELDDNDDERLDTV